jgi:hypothetical protein
MHIGSRLFLAVSLLVACDPKRGSTSGEIPERLVHVEELAEDAYDKSLVSDFAAVATDADDIASAWSSYRAQGEADGAHAADLEAMDAAVAGLRDAAASATDPATVARAANAVSSRIDELFDLYDPIVPAEILALDYLGREVVLDAMQLDFDRASADTDTLEATWKLVRAEVLRSGGTMEASDYDASITDTRAAITAMNAEQLANEANVALEIVDAIEGVFER